MPQTENSNYDCVKHVTFITCWSPYLLLVTDNPALVLGFRTLVLQLETHCSASTSLIKHPWLNSQCSGMDCGLLKNWRCWQSSFL